MRRSAHRLAVRACERQRSGVHAYCSMDLGAGIRRRRRGPAVARGSRTHWIRATTRTEVAEPLTTLGWRRASCFGLVVMSEPGTLARRTDGVALWRDPWSEYVAGRCDCGLFNDKQRFGLYSIGLAVGFFGYLALCGDLGREEEHRR